MTTALSIGRLTREPYLPPDLLDRAPSFHLLLDTETSRSMCPSCNEPLNAQRVE